MSCCDAFFNTYLQRLHLQQGRRMGQIFQSFVFVPAPQSRRRRVLSLPHPRARPPLVANAWRRCRRTQHLRHADALCCKFIPRRRIACSDASPCPHLPPPLVGASSVRGSWSSWTSASASSLCTIRKVMFSSSFSSSSACSGGSVIRTGGVCDCVSNCVCVTEFVFVSL